MPSPSIIKQEAQMPAEYANLSADDHQPAAAAAVAVVEPITSLTTLSKSPSPLGSAASAAPIKIDFDSRIKRKNVLALNEKVAAIREYDKTPVYKHVGRLFNCSPDQIKRIVKQREQILAAWEQRTRRSQNAKTIEMKMVRVSMLGKAVFEYIRRMMYYQDFIISDAFLQRTAISFRSVMGLRSFFPQLDWCREFRTTYNITSNETKRLSIAHAQGFSVQFKDIVHDVLTECSASAEGDDDASSGRPVHSIDPAGHRSAGSETDGNDSDVIDTTPSSSLGGGTKQRLAGAATSQSPTLTSSLSNFQPLRQLLTLPLDSKDVTGTSRKVLLATPINQPKKKGTTNPLTMTIIPLSSLAGTTSGAKSASGPARSAAGSHPMPTPMIDIKREIKEEPNDDDGDYDDEFAACLANFVKPEMFSDAEEEHNELRLVKNMATPTGQENSNDSVVVLEESRMSTATKRKCSTVEESALTFETNKKPKEGDNAPASNAIIQVEEMTTQNDKNNNRNVHENNAGPAKIKSCGEARRYLRLLEEFAHQKESLRLVGLITRADELLREMDENRDRDTEFD